MKRTASPGPGVARGFTVPRWGGRRAQSWTRAVLAEYGAACHLRLEGCTGTATTGDHVKPFSTHPHLRYVVSNGRPACGHCNSARGARPLRSPEKVDARGWFE